MFASRNMTPWLLSNHGSDGGPSHHANHSGRTPSTVTFAGHGPPTSSPHHHQHHQHQHHHHQHHHHQHHQHQHHNHQHHQHQHHHHQHLHHQHHQHQHHHHQHHQHQHHGATSADGGTHTLAAADENDEATSSDKKLLSADGLLVACQSRSPSPGGVKRNASGGHMVEITDDSTSLQPHDCSKLGCQRIVINVSGQRFETQLRTLNRYPDTLLGNPTKRRRYWDARRNEVFIDRHRPTFQAILYYYQSGGRLRRPFEVPEDVFIEELEFYQLDESLVHEFKQKEGFVVERKQMPSAEWQRVIWLLCEEPESSRCARAFAVVSVSCILVSIVNFCTETIPVYADRPACVNITVGFDDDNEPIYKQVPNYWDKFFLVESVCVAWFTVEFLLRLVSCPSKRGFCRDVMNIFDVLAILPFFVTLATMQASSWSLTDGPCDVNGKKRGGGSFLFTRVLRVFRIFKLSKHSHGLRILGLTIKTSMRELGMFFFFLVVAMVIFSSAVYYAEAGLDGTQLTSIPDAFWWAIVTMTTVGYGDVTPIGVWGKLVGTLCVIAGVLTIALPVPVVVANFNNFYRHGSGAAGASNGM